MHSINDFFYWIGIATTISFCCMMTLNGCDAFSSFPIIHHIHHQHHHHHYANGNHQYSQKVTITSRVNLSTTLTIHRRFRTLLCATTTELNHLFEYHPVSSAMVSVSASSILRSDITDEITSGSTINNFMSISVSAMDSPIENDIIVPIIVIVALSIGILANGWIARLISGDQGLGSYLSDGSGYNKSKFKPIQQQQPKRKSNDNAIMNNDLAVQGNDPLPWLRLPNLDFVEVAGQPKSPPKQQSTLKNRITTTTITSSTDNTSITDITSNSSLVLDNNNNNNDNNETDIIALEELELLRLQMQDQLLLGNIVQAEQLRMTLERRMTENNIQFTNEMDAFQ